MPMRFLRVRELAEQQGLNMTSLSRKAEIAYGTARALWHDNQDQLNRRTLIRVAVALGVRVGDLFDDNAHEAPETADPETE